MHDIIYKWFKWTWWNGNEKKKIWKYIDDKYYPKLSCEGKPWGSGISTQLKIPAALNYTISAYDASHLVSLPISIIIWHALGLF